MGYLVLAFAISALLYQGWKLTSRSAYESAEYVVLQQAGDFELRKYPDLMLVTTDMSTGVADRESGRDGSFGRLFRYISGGNDSKQKVAMTTPVFMERQPESASDEPKARMGFVLPKEVAESSIPEPASANVEVTKRQGGTFAVIRFSGRMNPELYTDNMSKLTEWLEGESLQADGAPEVAGYDPPWTPGSLRRNEILVRVKTR